MSTIFPYLDMLGGAPLLLDEVGRFQSPLLSSICGTDGIGSQLYNFYVSFFTWKKEMMLRYLEAADFSSEITKRLNRDELTIFDVISLIPALRDLFQTTVSFFSPDAVTWSSDGTYVELQGDTEEACGRITRENYDVVQKAILQLNYIGLGETDAPQKFENETAKKRWETAQKFLAKQQRSGEDKGLLSLGNVVSKLCTVHPSYNLLNVFDLSVFQLYDQFFQCSYMRSANLNEAIFSNHGGESFNFQDWLKPIIKNP